MGRVLAGGERIGMAKIEITSDFGESEEFLQIKTKLEEKISQLGLRFTRWHRSIDYDSMRCEIQGPKKFPFSQDYGTLTLYRNETMIGWRSKDRAKGEQFADMVREITKTAIHMHFYN